MSTPLLDIRNLEVRFVSSDSCVYAVNGVSLHVMPSEVLGIVGESGCGKSVSAMSILRLLPERFAKINAERINFGGIDLQRLSEAEIRKIRGNRISMIFQEPMSSLNPVMKVGRQIGEALTLHRGMDKKQAMAEAERLLDLVRIPDARQRAGEYPHQLSGGMRQRVMIAIALACGPELLIADEPTTALDVTVQAQILSLMNDLQNRLGTSIILITHDLGVVAETAHRVVVMYAGSVVEEAPVGPLFKRPRHPYTNGLLDSIPKVRSSLKGDVERLSEIEGIVPSLTKRPIGCAFASRCHNVLDKCRESSPALEEIACGHRLACWNPV